MLLRFVRASSFVALAALACSGSAAAQGDPCVPAYRLSSCEGNDQACQTAEQRRWDEQVARCRAERARRAAPPTNNQPPPPAPVYAPAPRSPEDRERERREEERTRMNAAINDEMTKAENLEEVERVNKAIDAEMGVTSGGGPAVEPGKFGGTPSKKEGEQPEERAPVGGAGSDLWIVQPNAEKGLLPGVNGEWRYGEFVTSCNGGGRITYVTGYVTAYVGKEDGSRSCRGGFLVVENMHPKFPAYYGLSGVINGEVKPRQKAVVMLSIYRSKKDLSPLSVEVQLKWWEPSYKSAPPTTEKN